MFMCCFELNLRCNVIRDYIFIFILICSHTVIAADRIRLGLMICLLSHKEMIFYIKVQFAVY